jgi:small redox-active disulfide protein 2
MRIEVLGPGCPKCANAEQNVRKALDDLKIQAEVLKVTDIDAIIEKGVLHTSALVIDGKLALQGKIPTVEQIKQLLKVCMPGTKRTTHRSPLIRSTVLSAAATAPACARKGPSPSRRSPY